MATALTVQERQRAVFTVLLVELILFLFGFSTVAVLDRRQILSQVIRVHYVSVVECHFTMKQMKQILYKLAYTFGVQ